MTVPRTQYDQTKATAAISPLETTDPFGTDCRTYDRDEDVPVGEADQECFSDLSNLTLASPAPFMTQGMLSAHNTFLLEDWIGPHDWTLVQSQYLTSYIRVI